MSKHFKRILFTFSTLLISIIFSYKFFYNLYTSNSIIIPYGLNDFDICITNPLLWKYIKFFYIIFLIISNIICSNAIFSILPQKHSSKKIFSTSKSIFNDSFNIFIGTNLHEQPIYLTEHGLYQNILITGTIGTGKTSSAMYPFTKQLIKQNHTNPLEKLALLILDVKGNYHKIVYQYAKFYNRLDDLIILELNKAKFNPLHKPNLKPQILSNRLRTILTLFSTNNSDTYWLDKTEETLTECIKLCRLYNNGYVTFVELHKLVTDFNYYNEKINFLKHLFLSGQMSSSDTYGFLSSINFFEKEFFSLDSRTLSIIKSEITRITNPFVNDLDMINTFSPPISELSFSGFKEVLDTGKIVVLNMNISEYTIVSKIIASYLKLDFQTEILMRLNNNLHNNLRPAVFICDEYHEYVTSSDATFFSQSREARCINIVSTQSYTSLFNTLHDKNATMMIIQNLVNKLWLRTDDSFTIEEIQKQLGKIEKEKLSTTISENSKETFFNYFTHSLNSKNSNISESINTYTQLDNLFDNSFFTQKLESFSCISFLSDGNQITPPAKLKLIPYFIQDKYIY